MTNSANALLAVIPHLSSPRFAAVLDKADLPHVEICVSDLRLGHRKYAIGQLLEQTNRTLTLVGYLTSKYRGLRDEAAEQVEVVLGERLSSTRRDAQAQKTRVTDAQATAEAATNKDVQAQRMRRLLLDEVVNLLFALDRGLHHRYEALLERSRNERVEMRADRA